MMRIQLLFLGLLLTTHITLPAALLARLKYKQRASTLTHHMPIRRYSDWTFSDWRVNKDFPTSWTFTAGAIGGGIIGMLAADTKWSTLTLEEKEAAYKKSSLVTIPVPFPGLLIGGTVGLSVGLLANHGIKGALVRLGMTSAILAASYSWGCLHEKRSRELSALKQPPANI